MSKDIDYNAKVRTNLVFLTAKTAVCLMAEAGIPDAADIVHRLGIHDSSSIPGMTDQEMILGNALVVEAKYRTMCRLIENSGYQTNVDLPCGYTPKALHLSDKGLCFFGLDLPIVAQEMEPIIFSLSEHPERIRFHGVDATNYESLQAAPQDAEGPLCITTEGMMILPQEMEMICWPKS